MRFEQEQVVETTAAAAFLACDSAEHQVRWMASLVGVEIDPDQPWGVGSRFRQVHEEMGVRQVFEGELLEYEPERRIVTRLEHDDLSLHGTLEFEDLGGQCKVLHRVELELKSTALRLMEGTVGRVLAKRFEEDLARLKDLLETG